MNYDVSPITCRLVYVFLCQLAMTLQEVTRVLPPYPPTQQHINLERETLRGLLVSIDLPGVARGRGTRFTVRALGTSCSQHVHSPG